MDGSSGIVAFILGGGAVMMRDKYPGGLSVWAQLDDGESSSSTKYTVRTAPLMTHPSAL
jgi:hypothetical protein